MAKMKWPQFVLAMAAMSVLPGAANASVIAWSTPSAITTDGSASDVLNTGGSVIAAEYAGGADPTETVNGITFSDGLTDYTGYQGEFTGGLNGFTTNNASYDAILNGFDYDGNNPNTLTISGLIPGTTYDVQLWGLDDRDCCNGRTENFSTGLSDANASSTFALGSNVSTIGTFVADGTGQQVIYINGAGQFQSNLNAFSVQAIPVVPEPASLALAGMAGIGLMLVIAKGKRRSRLVQSFRARSQQFAAGTRDCQ